MARSALERGPFTVGIAEAVLNDWSTEEWSGSSSAKTTLHRIIFLFFFDAFDAFYTFWSFRYGNFSVFFFSFFFL